MSKIVVNNLAVEYRDEGTGPIILMLHGWWRTLSDFDPLVEILKNNFRIIRLDLPGFGGTEMPKRIWKVGDYADFVQNFLKKINVTPFVVIGHSFGGRVVLKNQFGAERLILISSPGIKVDNFRKAIFKIIAKIGDIVSHIPPFVFIRKKLRNKFYNFLGSDYLDSGQMKEIFKVVVDEDLSVFAATITLPTLLIWGRDDKVTPLFQAQGLYKLIKNSKLEIMNATGHFSFLDKPTEVAKLIEDFCLTQ